MYSRLIKLFIYPLWYKEIDIVKEKVEKQKSHASVLKMLEKQTYTTEQIAELTGLSKKEIETLKKGNSAKNIFCSFII